MSDETDSPAAFTVTGAQDKPTRGMWPSGPNPGWVTVRHNASGISATARHRQQHKAWQIARACVELMLAENDAGDAQFPEALSLAETEAIRILDDQLARLRDT